MTKIFMKEFALFWRRRPTSRIWLAKVIYRWSYFCYLSCFTQNSIQQYEININVSHHYCYYCYPDLYTSHLYFCTDVNSHQRMYKIVDDTLEIKYISFWIVLKRQRKKETIPLGYKLVPYICLFVLRRARARECKIMYVVLVINAVIYESTTCL